MKNLVQFSKFLCVGLLATAIHTTTLIFLVERLKIEPVLASLPAFTVALITSYFLNHHWTFLSISRHFYYFPKYVLVSVLGLGLNLGIMYAVVDLLGAAYEWGLFLVILSLPVLTFLLHRFWTFYDESRV